MIPIADEKKRKMMATILGPLGLNQGDLSEEALDQLVLSSLPLSSLLIAWLGVWSLLVFPS